LPSGRRHYRLTLKDALSAHKRAISFGGRDGVPNLALVQSAIARPYNGYYRGIAWKAAALVESMASNHGFTDGNKRTTLILLHTFLQRSGYKLVAVPGDLSLQEAVENMILDVVNRRMDFGQLIDWLKARVVASP